MNPVSGPREPLARSTLLKMGARVAVIIALSTLFSFLHIRQALRAEILEQLQQQVSERAEREQAIFVLAEDDHALIKKTFLEQFQAFQSQQEEVDARFDKLFVRPPDGTVRSRPEVDGSRMVQVFVPRGVVLDAVLRARILAAYDVLTRFSPVFHLRFKTTYITFPEGVVVAFMPTTPTWSQAARAESTEADHLEWRLQGGALQAMDGLGGHAGGPGGPSCRDDRP